MIKYQVRSRDLIDLVNDVRSGRLILSPYFQRNLVWRDLHKRDFIDTILKGYPFPQIFIARGDIDVESMTSQSCVVDGQQRMNAIMEFVTDLFSASGRKFSEMDLVDKEEFLKYQIPVIDLEMKATDPSVIDVFKRLNRTFYSLSTIEKMATEYSSVDLMLISKYICGFFSVDTDDDDTNLSQDPNLPPEFLSWAKTYDVSAITELVSGGRIFTGYENSRMVHLMWVLNLVSTIRFGYFARNDKTKELLDLSEDIVPTRDRLLIVLQRAARFFQSLNLSDVPWWSKSNSFTLMVVIVWNIDALERLGVDIVREKLEDFGRNLPGDYALAAREAVNNLRQRRLRHERLAQIIGVSTEETPFEGSLATPA
ncbi:DUF262 domain-containing protein [Pleomorphomonas sp. PLEO]|uniref:DUF262 domain-containing protein n=1 Tax=Pleomorphomonas sp. PLEO TaxID=3239306 RepID=UPI00351ED679